MNIIFFSTSDFGVPILEILAKHHKILAVVTTPDAKVGRKQKITPSPISKKATELNLHVLKPEKLKNNSEVVTELKRLNADLFIVVAYGKIVPQKILDIPAKGAINIHGSILPKFRGASPIQYALLNGENKTGITIMLMDAEVDHGPILSIAEISIDPEDTYLSLSKKLSELASKLIISTLENFEAGQIIPQAQEHTQATFTKMISKEDGKIDWNMSASEIVNKLRAFNPWPGIWTTWDGQILKITSAKVGPASTNTESPKEGFVTNSGEVTCGSKTSLQILKLQLAGKPETDIESFLRGHKNFVGSKLI